MQHAPPVFAVYHLTVSYGISEIFAVWMLLFFACRVVEAGDKCHMIDVKCCGSSKLKHTHSSPCVCFSLVALNPA